jgi:hypothetical protein
VIRRDISMSRKGVDTHVETKANTSRNIREEKKKGVLISLCCHSLAMKGVSTTSNSENNITVLSIVGY